MKKAFKAYTPHAMQWEFHKSQAQTKIVKAPIRSGKTIALVYEAIKLAWNITEQEKALPDLPSILLVAPTYSQVKSLLFEPVRKIVQEAGLMESANSTAMQIELKNKRMMYFRSLANNAPETIRGLTCAAVLVDEAALCSAEAIDILRGRLATTGGPLVLASTPKGKNNFFYKDYFSPEASVKNVEVFSFSIYDNPAISWDYIDDLRAIYSPAFFKQECLGEFVSLAENRVYYAFDEGTHVDDVPIPASPHKYSWFIGVDYNVGKMATIIGYVVSSQEIHIVREIYGSLSTQQLIPQIKAVLPLGAQARVYDDANSGHARNQLTGQTNRDLFKQAGIQTHLRTSNPPVLERLDRVNSVLYNKKIKIDRSCKHLIAELANMEYKNNTLTPDDQSGKCGHITDAFGYAMFELNPISYAHSRPVVSN